MEITRKECCCDEMWKAVSSVNRVPVNIEKCGHIGHEFYRFDLEFVDAYDPEGRALRGEIAADSVLFCPFCGKQILPCEVNLSNKWKDRGCMCEDFLEWFMEGDSFPNKKAPTPMFRYEPRENQFYMHHRKGFGEGWIPVKYCIYCGEPLAEMVEKCGLPEVIADHLDPSPNGRENIKSARVKKQ